MNFQAVIRGMGAAVPETIVTNNDLAQIVDTNDEWIVQRTGIKERRLCKFPHEGAGYLASNAGREAMERTGVAPDEIDMVIVATVSGDYIWPSTACNVQDALGIKNAGAFDVSAACAGFIYALDVSSALVQCGRVRQALVIGVDCLSKQVDWSDRTTCVLFGDAAGAAIVRAESNTDRGLIRTVTLSDGSGATHIAIEAGGSKFPFGSPQAEGKKACITMNGREVYRFAVKAMGDACERVLKEAGMTIDDVDLFVPHQANLRIIESAADRLNLCPDKVFLNVEKYGNTSGGSIPLALYEAERDGALQPGMVVMTVGFGAGLVWGANLIRW
jgi:3-oxoacyl-[acyl-carrier-protein] synthase-3